MKTIVINADPKRKGINARLMKSALKGAESVGAETQYVDLYKMKISGCRVCLICKNDEDVCKCYWRDELSPLIEDIFSCDCLLIGVPIFLLERLIYSLVSYQIGNKFKGKVNVGLFYTINHPRGYFEKSIKPHLKASEDLLEMLNGEVVIDSFSNISKNMYANKSEEEIRKKEKQLELDLEKVFYTAGRLSSKKI